jgi:hypothetical protein
MSQTKQTSADTRQFACVDSDTGVIATIHADLLAARAERSRVGQRYPGLMALEIIPGDSRYGETFQVGMRPRIARGFYTSESSLPPRVVVRFTSGRTVTRLFPSRAEAERYAADLETWAYVARLEVLPTSHSEVSK